MKLETLQKSRFPYRWAKSDPNGMVLEISVEKNNLTPEFLKFLKKRKFKQKLGREDFETEHFVRKMG